MSRKNKNIEENQEIDARIRATLQLQKRDKLAEKDKQAKIYAAMDKIQIVRN